MDRMLHRGKYAIEGSRKDALTEETIYRKIGWSKVIGIDRNFTRGDKWIAGGLFGWSMFWFVVMAVGTLWNMISPWSISVWSVFWRILGIGFPILFTFVTGIWFTWGGLRDMRALFRRLREEKVNHLDDGTVYHQNDEPAGEKIPAEGNSVR